MDALDGQVLLVTGGATGLGAAVAALAAGRGARVAILDTNVAQGEAHAAAIGARFWRLDVGDGDAWTRVLDDVENAFDPVRFAHLNAGIMSRPLTPALAPFGVDEFTTERYRALMAVNVDGVFHGVRLLLPRMTALGSGALTITSSTGGLVPIAFDPVYSMTKHALIGLVRSIAAALPEGPVRINAICPGGFSSVLLPPELRTADTMTPTDVARDVLDLLENGRTGEVRVRAQKQGAGIDVLLPAF